MHTGGFMRTTSYHTLHRTGSPPAEPVTLAQAKQYLRVDDTSEDSLITDLITAVRIYAEDYTGRSLTVQDWQVTYRDHLPAVITLPRPPAQAILSLTQQDEGGAVSTIDSSSYRLLDTRRLSLDTPRCAALFTLTYTSGEHPLSASVTTQAMLNHLARCYEYRGDMAPLPPQVRELYDQRREARL
jgi:uncharacterized phiE125 gp8 family phage protein